MPRLSFLPCVLLLLGCPADDVGEEGSETGDPPMTDSADDSAALGCAAEIEHDTTDGAPGDLQQMWGAACETDADCVALLGDGAVCLFEAVIYELPLGYCTKPCTLGPDERVIENDPACAPTGVDCIGNNAVGFEYCAPPCTDDGQCGRDGYTCRLMPMIAMEGDPTYCLMPDCCDFLSCSD
jgi:hypothetical protein